MNLVRIGPTVDFSGPAPVFALHSEATETLASQMCINCGHSSRLAPCCQADVGEIADHHQVTPHLAPPDDHGSFAYLPKPAIGSWT